MGQLARIFYYGGYIMIDYEAVPVDFTLDRFEKVQMSIEKFIQLRAKSICFIVGKGKNAVQFEIVHTNAGFVDIYTGINGAYAEWLADHFDIEGVVADEKNNHFLVIKHNGHILRLPFEGLLPDKICSTFFSKGIAISKVNDAHEAFSMYLQSVINQLKVTDARQTLGWTVENDVLQWNGTDSEPPYLQYHLEMSQEEYLSELNRLTEPSPQLQFVLCAAAASSLLAYLKIKEKLPVTSFGVSLVGTSSTGKTTALQLAASLYTSPEDETVFSAFYGTYNALMKILGCHHGVVICYDETTIKNDISKSSFVYAFTQGKDKLRLNSDSELKFRNSWNCTALFSSEEYLIDASKDNLGIVARVITLDHLTYTTDSSHSEQIKTFAGKNYGLIGKLLSDYLLLADSAEILEEYEAARADLLNKITEKCSLTERLTMNYALIITTSQILNRLGVLTNTDVIKQMCVILHEEVSAAANPGKNLVIKIFNYICSNYKKIDGVKWTLSKERKPVKVEILEATFKEILEKTGDTDEKTAVKFLLDEGFIVPPEKNRIKAKISIDGAVSYGYRFDYKKVDVAFGTVNDEVYTYRKKYRTSDPYGSVDVIDERNVIYAGSYKITDKQEPVEGTLFLL